MERIVLAYSGRLDTSVAIPWLKEHHDAEIVAVTMDLGQGRELEAVRDRALAIGAMRAHVLDLREAFAHDFVLPALKADALFDDRSPMTAALARPLIAQKLVEIADIEHAHVVAHGGSGTGRRAAFDVLIRALNPKLKIIAPARDWGMGRAEVAAYARAHGVALPADVDSPYRSESNLWGRSIECSTLDDGAARRDLHADEAGARVPRRTGVRRDRSSSAASPAAVNSVAMPLIELIAALNIIASAHGVGRIDAVEHRLGGNRLAGNRRGAGGRAASRRPPRAPADYGASRARTLLPHRQRRVRRYHLQRLVVFAAAQGAQRICRIGAGTNLWHGAVETLQGRVLHRRPQRRHRAGAGR